MTLLEGSRSYLFAKGRCLYGLEHLRGMGCGSVMQLTEAIWDDPIENARAELEAMPVKRRKGKYGWCCDMLAWSGSAHHLSCLRPQRRRLIHDLVAIRNAEICKRWS